MHRIALGSLAIIMLAGCAHRPKTPLVDPVAFKKDHQVWQKQRVEKLKRENGWLALAGLYWLKPGENRIGSDTGNDVVFPQPAPAQVGLLVLEGKTARLQVSAGVPVTCQGQPVVQRELRSDADPKIEPDRIVLGQFTFWIIQRGEKTGLRLFDNQSRKRTQFAGIPAYPADPAWVVIGRFEPYNQPKKLPFTTVIQTTTEVDIPGELVFEHQGQEHRLLPIAYPDSQELFIVFGDKTNGHETYGGGRFLSATPSADNRVVLDFNQAVNPPCAFTRYATCPIPRKENRLPFKVEAGEKKVGDH